jgi:hypothetical protein
MPLSWRVRQVILTICEKVLKTVFVNIIDFLEAVEHREPVYRFPSQVALAKYTKTTRRTYPKGCIASRNPLGGLLTDIIHERIPRRRRKNGGGSNGNGQQDLINGMIGLAIAV